MSAILFVNCVLLGFLASIRSMNILETRCDPSPVYYLNHDLHVYWSNYEPFQTWKERQADPCKPHHFCVDWFPFREYYKYMPCGYGFFNSKTASTDPADCLPCPEKKYCFAGVFDCPIGYYCLEGGLPKEPWPGFNAPSVGLSEPLECPAGTYQPYIQHRKWEWQGINGCLICPKHMFCDVTKLAEPAGFCDNGWECGRGETSPRPAGKQCEPGTYCVNGKKLDCARGFYQPYSGMHVCFSCPKGKYCPGSKLADPTGNCTSDFGIYCQGYSSSICTEGFMCSDGIKIPCGRGHYQDTTKQNTCKRCPVGSYCDGKALGQVSGSCDADCCTEDGQIAHADCTEKKSNCNQGEYRKNGVCVPCDPGFYCGKKYLAAPSGYCDLGWFCDSGETTPAPVGKYCPAGHRCSGGVKVKCGFEYGRYTYQPNRGQYFCIRCPEHFNCTEPGLSNPLPLCDPGFECKAGLITPCAIGSYCYGGKSYVCRPGFKTTTEGQSICERCGPGVLCKDGNELPCPVNRVCYNGLAHYCELGFTCAIVNGNLVKTPCEPGTERFELESDSCLPCRQFRYCRRGASYECFRYHKGFACLGGAETPFSNVAQPGQHYELVFETYDTNRGYVIKDCAAGTYQPDKHRGVCLPCKIGYYCNTEGMSTPTICPAQLRCPKGSVTPIPCAWDQPNEGQSQC